MDTRFWGPSGWRLLHLTLETPLDARKNIREFYELIPYVLPCKFCRNSLSGYYEKRPIPKSFEKMSHWLYEIHNDVNNKLRSQKIAVEPNPTYNEIKERYAKWAAMPCASTQVLGWDFLFSVANTTPMRGALSPMDGAPDTCDDPLLRNQWNMMNYKERIPYYKKWWNLIEDVLPFEPWRKAWFAARGTHGQAPIEKGKRAVLSWLFSMEQTICKKMAEDAPHDSFYGLCKEVSAFSSGCGKKTSRRVKTCRAKKDAARETLRRARNARNSNNVA